MRNGTPSATGGRGRRSLLARAGLTTRSRRFRGDERGATMLEFAIIAVPFFGLMFGIIEVAIVAWGTYELENATQDAARLIRTGQQSDKDKIKEEICERTLLLGNCAEKLKLSAVSCRGCSMVLPPNPLSEGKLNESVFEADKFSPGGARDVVLVSAFYEWQLVNFITAYSIGNMGNGNRLLQASAVFRNEPFPE